MNKLSLLVDRIAMVARTPAVKTISPTTHDRPRSPRLLELRPKARRNPGCTARVLVADNEQIIADTLMLILIAHGFEAEAVYNVGAAVDALIRFKPDVFISDVNLPGMTGLEAAVAIQANRPNCKVLLFTSHASTADLLGQVRARGDAFVLLSKPVHPALLLQTLRQLLTQANSPDLPLEALNPDTAQAALGF